MRSLFVRRGAVLGAAFLAVLWLGGCGGSSTGSGVDSASIDGGAARASMSIKVVDSAVSAKSLDAADAVGGLVTVTAARAAVDRVELELPGGRSCSDVSIDLSDCSCNSTDSSPDVAKSSSLPDSSDANELFFNGPFVVDLLTGVSNPSLDSLTIPSGVYHSLQLKLRPLDPASALVAAGDLLLGNSMIIEASFDAAGQPTKMFRVVLSQDHEIQFESDTAGLTIGEASAVNALILGLDVNSWFADIDVGACLASGAPVQDANGVFVVDASVAGDACNILGKLKDNVESSSQFSELPDDSAS